MTTPGTDPSAAAQLIGAKLAARSRHICVFLGAGAPAAAGLPVLAALQQKVLEKLDESQRAKLAELFKRTNLEGALTNLRLLRLLLTGTQSVGGITSELALTLDDAICEAIVLSVAGEDAKDEAFVQFASWASRNAYDRPLEVFTINYDLMLERGFEALGALYFDGFVGSQSARFRAELVDPVADTRANLPPAWIRLWKLHGSVNWKVVGDAMPVVVRVGEPVKSHAAAIYPSAEKYQDSRRVPFVVLMDRFRRALAEPETLLLVNGYSFSDEHINEMIFDAGLRYPRSEVIALCHGQIPAVLKAQALRSANLTVYAPDSLVWSGVESTWSAHDEVKHVWEGGAFKLGDFDKLARYLAGVTGA